MILQRLLEQKDKASVLRAFIPLPPPFSPVQFVELRLSDARFYRCFDDGSDAFCTDEYAGPISDSSVHMILLAGDTMAELRFVRTDGGTFCNKDNTMFAWLARLAAQGLEGDITRDGLETTLATLQQERDHDRVLVDIINIEV